MAGLQQALAKAEQEKDEAVANREAAEKAQKAAEEKLALTKANTHNTHTNKEKIMATASETELDVPALQALGRAASLLEPHRAHPVVAGLVGELKAATEGPEDETNESDDDSMPLEKIEEKMMDASTARVTLTKSDRYDPREANRLEKEERRWQTAYAKKSSGAWQGWRGEHLERMRKVEGGV